MDENYDFRELFVLDLANNHQGSVEHGLDIIRGVAEAAKLHAGRHAHHRLQRKDGSSKAADVDRYHLAHRNRGG